MLNGGFQPILPLFALQCIVLTLRLYVVYTVHLVGIEIYNGTQMIHNRLNVLRAERSISRKDLADAVGVNFQTIGYLERGDYSPSLELALKISAFFGLPVEMIFSLEPFETLTSQLLKAKGSPNG